MDYELLEICQSIYEVMSDAEHDMNELSKVDLRFEDSVVATIIHQRDKILKSLIAELVQVYELNQRNP